MTVLHSVDFFPSGKAPVAIEPRLPLSLNIIMISMKS